MKDWKKVECGRLLTEDNVGVLTTPPNQKGHIILCDSIVCWSHYLSMTNQLGLEVEEDGS